MLKVANKEELIKVLRDRFESKSNLKDIDVSEVEDFEYLFTDAFEVEATRNLSNKFFEGIEDWDMSSAVNICKMFKYCEKFNRSLDKWKIPNVKMAFELFKCCYSLKIQQVELVKQLKANGVDLWKVNLSSDVSGKGPKFVKKYFRDFLTTEELKSIKQ